MFYEGLQIHIGKTSEKPNLTKKKKFYLHTHNKNLFEWPIIYIPNKVEKL